MDHHPLTPGPTIGLLLSERVDTNEGERIDMLARSAGVSLRRYTAARLEDPCALHAAFFSRELFEGSSLRTPGAVSNAFFEIVDAAENLEWLHVFTSGLDLPQYAVSLDRGVTVTPSSGVTAKPIAASVLAAVLGQSRGFPHWLAAQNRREWSPLRGPDAPRDIEGQKAVVLGAGPIGTEIARLLGAVGFHTTAVRRTAKPSAGFDRSVSLDALDDILPECDWLILALPLTDDTRQVIDARRFGLLPPHARFVNIARGELVDEAALIDALRNGRLAGGYLDTFVSEPLPPNSPLWSLPNVWLSPHNSAASQGHDQRVVEAFIRELQGWLARRQGTPHS